MKNYKIVKRAARPTISSNQSSNLLKSNQISTIKVNPKLSKKSKCLSIPPKLTPPTSLTSSCYSEDAPRQPAKVIMLQTPVALRKPDDFIEPVPDLSIPSTAVFYKHRNLSEPIPEIRDSTEYKKSLKKSQKIIKKQTPVSKTIKTKSIKNSPKVTASKSLDMFAIKLMPQSPSKKIIRKLK